jgi:hypothetical protein
VLAPWPALGATLAVALVPAHIEMTRIGAVDHHAFEPLLLWAALAALLRRTTGLAVVAGLALALDFAVSPTALVAAVLVVPVALWMARRDARAPVVALGCAALGTAAVSAVMGTLGRVSADELSALQPLMLAGAAALALGASRLPVGRPRLIAFAVGGAAVLGVLLASGRLNGIIGFAGRRGIIGSVVETRGLFAFGLIPAVEPLTALVLLVPLAALVSLKRRGTDDARVALAFVATATLAITLQQRRFMHLAALPAAIVLVDAAGALATTRARAAVLAAVAVLGCWPALRYFVETPPDATARHQGVRELAPLLGTLPRGGVLAQWPYGHVITRFAGQPVVASPMLTPRTEPAVLAATRTLLDEDPARALAAIDARRVRWVVATAIPPGVTQRYLDALGDGRPASDVAAHALTTRLIAADGDGVPGLRELARSSNGAAALFERVTGARLEGTAPPGSPVTARLVLTDGPRRFAVRQQTRAGSDGRFALALPYPTTPDPRVPVQAQSRWELVRQDHPPVSLDVPPGAVESGAAIDFKDNP